MDAMVEKGAKIAKKEKDKLLGSLTESSSNTELGSSKQKLELAALQEQELQDQGAGSIAENEKDEKPISAQEAMAIENSLYKDESIAAETKE